MKYLFINSVAGFGSTGRIAGGAVPWADGAGA